MKDGTIRFGGMGGSVAAAVRDDGMRKVKNLQGVLRLLFSAFCLREKHPGISQLR